MTEFISLRRTHEIVSILTNKNFNAVSFIISYKVISFCFHSNLTRVHDILVPRWRGRGALCFVPTFFINFPHKREVIAVGLRKSISMSTLQKLSDYELHLIDSRPCEGL